MRAGNETLASAVAAVAAACLFGTSYVATAYMLRSFSPLSGAFWRSAVACVVLLTLSAAAAFRGPAQNPIDVGPADKPPAISWLWRSAVLAILGGPVFQVGLNLSVAAAGATITAFIIGVSAAVAAVLATLLLREPLESPAVAGFVLAVVGTLLLAQFRGVASMGAIAPGFAAATGYAFFLVLGRRWSGPYRLAPRTLTLWATAVTAVSLLVWSAVTHAQIIPQHFRADALFALAWLAIVLVVGQTLVVVSIRRLQGRRSSAFLLLNPLTAALLGSTLLGEQLSSLQLLGAFLVLAGMALATGLADLFRRRLKSMVQPG